MANDPAFLFYTGDFHTGTQFFTDEQAGKYLRLLMAQHQHGHLSEKQMLYICKSHDIDIWKKFEKDQFGNFFNLRLENEILKRKSFSESRSANRLGKTKDLPKHKKNKSKSYVNHMENENENKDINTIEKRNEDFIKALAVFLPNYTRELLNDFHRYWSESNTAGTQMKFEMEKTWDISKRLITWSKRDKQFNPNGKSTTTDERDAEGNRKTNPFKYSPPT